MSGAQAGFYPGFCVQSPGGVEESTTGETLSAAGHKRNAGTETSVSVLQGCITVAPQAHNLPGQWYQLLNSFFSSSPKGEVPVHRAEFQKHFHLHVLQEKVALPIAFFQLNKHHSIKQSFAWCSECIASFC